MSRRRHVASNGAVYYKYLPVQPRGKSIPMHNTHGVTSTMPLARLGNRGIHQRHRDIGGVSWRQSLPLLLQHVACAPYMIIVHRYERYVLQWNCMLRNDDVRCS